MYPTETATININPTVRLEPGGIYVVQTTGMTGQGLNNLRDVLNDEEQRLGVKVLLLPPGASVATVGVIADDLVDPAGP